jgi:DNA-directed RNA polymerase specialized sigma24 family protein
MVRAAITIELLEDLVEELVRYARALLLLQLKQVEMSAQAGKGPGVRAEVLLADAGFGAREISDLLGKNYAAVAKAISRARAAKAKEPAQDESDAGGDSGE